MENETSLDSSEKAEILVGWDCKVSLMGLQRERALKIHSMNRGR